MVSVELRTTLLSIVTLASLGAFASRGVLKADGIIRIKGADITAATITVVPGNAASYILPVSAKHVTLELLLDDVYLISVEREGCPTKELYFDTRVPVEMHAQEFDFPFKVTLEHLTPERMFSYAAPVGFVRYVHGLKDFGYETQYIIQVEDELRERMKSIRENGVDPKTMAPVVSARMLERERGGYSAPLGYEMASEGTVAPMVSQVPKLVHVLSATRGTQNATLARVLDLLNVLSVIRSVPPIHLVAGTPQNAEMRMVKTVSVARVQPTTVRLIHAASPSPSRSVEDALPASMNDAVSRSEEVITEARRVTHVVRFSRASGLVHEYRKVVHAFGGVYYFQDGVSITERAFDEAVGA